MTAAEFKVCTLWPDCGGNQYTDAGSQPIDQTHPDVGAVRLEKEVTLSVDDGNHDHVVDDGTDEHTPNLGEEHGAGRNLQVLAHLQVTSQVNGGGDDVVRPHGEL